MGKILTLGEKLAAAREAREEVRLQKEREALEAAARELERRLNRIRHWIFSWNEKLVDDIEAGKEPEFKVMKYDAQEWVKEAMLGRAKYGQDLWDTWVRDLNDENLALTVNHEHDGMGVQSWIVLRLEPHFD